MDASSIFYKIKQTGKSTLNERKFLRKEIKEHILNNSNSIERQGVTTLINFEGTPIASLTKRNSKTSLNAFGYFKPLLEEAPNYSDEIISTILRDSTREALLPLESFKEVTKPRSQKQNGYGFEFGLILGLEEACNRQNIPFTVEKDRAYYNLFNNFKTLSEEAQNEFKQCGFLSAQEIIVLENLANKKSLIIKAQLDREGIKGDVRDILITADGAEIGVSCKNNNEAAKHPRISPNLDFIFDWFRVSSGASNEYKQDIKLIFDKLEPFIGQTWNIIEKNSPGFKAQTFYQPILQAVAIEIEKQLLINSDIASNLFKFIIGYQDFYKVIKKDFSKTIEIQSYNLNKTLNTNSLLLPTQIKSHFFKSNRQGIINKIIIEFDNDWALSFRIHNASETVENSFKFDIGIESSPEIFTKKLLF